MNSILDRNDVKKKIKESLISTKERKREHGFDIFVDGSTSDIVIGDKDSVSTDTHSKGSIRRKPSTATMLSNENRGNFELEGSFHTHTARTRNNDVVPSPADIKSSVTGGIKFFCIGANTKDEDEESSKVRCFDTDKLKSELEDTHKDINAGAKQIANKMSRDRNYLDRLSTKRVYQQLPSATCAQEE